MLCRTVLALIVYIQDVNYLGIDVFYYICRSVFSITLGLHICIHNFMSAAHCSLRLPLFQVPHVNGWEHM